MEIIRKVLARFGFVRARLRNERMAEYVAALRRTGMRVGDNVAIYNCVLDTNFPFLIEIGSNCVITHATILAHDASPSVHGLGLIAGPVKIGSRVFIGAGAVVLPGVTIGDDSIVGAAAVVTKDVGANTVVVGNPAQVICTIEEWKRGLNRGARNRKLISSPQVGMVPTEMETEEIACLVSEAFGGSSRFSRSQER